MRRTFFKSKIHRATVTQADLDYEGSVTIDEDLMDAAGRDPIFVETVGVGQDEVEIAAAADVTVVVLVPGLGDEVQALKAGIMEVADVFAVNKADRDGADRLVAEIRAMLSLAAHEGRLPAIVKTVATADQGVDDLLHAIDEFRAGAESSGLLERKRRALLARQLEDVLRDRLMRRMRARSLAASRNNPMSPCCR